MTRSRVLELDVVQNEYPSLWSALALHKTGTATFSLSAFVLESESESKSDLATELDIYFYTLASLLSLAPILPLCCRMWRVNELP